MAIYVRILQENSINLWVLSSRERLERILEKASFQYKKISDISIPDLWMLIRSTGTSR